VIDGFAPNFAFQFGNGANAKNRNEFGGSALLTSTGPNMISDHWDLNLALTDVTSTDVPVSNSLALMSIGLLGFFVRKRKIV
jgi:hypothetical protein